MTLCTLRQELNIAKRNKYALAGLVVLGWEDAKFFVKAAEEIQCPIILQVGPNCRKNTPVEIMGPMLRKLAEDSSINIVTLLDHSTDLVECKRALDSGFSSIMFDGSNMEFNENIDMTCKAVELAKSYEASVEAELGVVGYDKGIKSKFTDPELAQEFYAATQVDALAISVGNTHLEQQKATEVDTKLISQIEKIVKCPLVIHGGAGVKNTQLHWLSKNTAICKINIGTELRKVFGENLREYLLNNPTIFDRIDILSNVYENIIPTTKKIILNLRPDK